MAVKGFKFELQGVKELMTLLDQLPTKAMKKTVIRKALLQAGKPIADQAATNAPTGDSGRLKKSIQASPKLKAYQKKFKKQDRSKVEIYIGSSYPTAHLIEFGTAERFTEEGAKRGSITPNPFLRKAWDSLKGNALKDFAKAMESELMKAARSLAKKAEKGTLGKAQRRGLMGWR
jgi:HK97 gp10 family phage protein